MTKKIKDLSVEECRTFCKKYWQKDKKYMYECKDCPLAHEGHYCNGFLIYFYEKEIERYKNGEKDVMFFAEDYEEFCKEYLLDPEKEVEL